MFVIIFYLVKLATLVIFSGVPITPTEKRSHNKIITNGSLPRSVTVNNPNFVQTTDGYYRRVNINIPNIKIITT